jgi:hypothetical protein
MEAYARLGTVDEHLVCLLRAVKNAEKMPVINESNLMATCDHMENLIAIARRDIAIARSEISWYGHTDRQGGSF